MKGMSTKERIDEICEISGLSEAIVRRVFDAERKSIIKSISNGQKATLIGRCIIRPEIRTKIAVGGEVAKYIKLYSTVTPSLESEVRDCVDMEAYDASEDEGPDVLINQIPGLI